MTIWIRKPSGSCARCRPVLRGVAGGAQSFDLLFDGLEITTGGQRLHSRAALEASLRRRNIEPSTFEDREAVLYP
jgi:aspartyl-tRNA synthetase